jgi:hypothetical protein
MNGKIKFNQTGVIISGKYEGLFLRIEETDENSGNFSILVSKDCEFSKYAEGYDYWAENFIVVQEILKETGWDVLWEF